MTLYILKSAICLTVLLTVYHLLLERNKMHRFNRFYLLLSLAAGLILPAVTIKVSSGVLDNAPILSQAITVQQTPIPVYSEPAASAPAQPLPQQDHTETIAILVYALITLILAARFAGNLKKIRSQINNNPRVKLKGASLVLMDTDVVPHSFFNYVFVNELEYKNGGLAEQILAHELTHVRQMHSLDVLFIETLRILFWFNPVFIFYKRAIQLNHEFLADDAVVNNYEVSKYQYLLLERAMLPKPISLTSSLNFSLTKKRLTMMIKTTSKLKIWTVRLALVPILAVMLLSFSTKSITKVHKIKPAVSAYPANKPESSDRAEGRYFAVQAQQKKDTQRATFSGEWKSNESISMGGNIVCSYGEGDRMLSKTMKIAEYADYLTIDVPNPSAGAANSTSQEKLAFNGEASEINYGSLGGKKFTVKLSADGQTMTVNSIVYLMPAKQQEFVNVTEVWKLSNDGKSISVQANANSTLSLFGEERSWKTVFNKVD